MTVGETAAWRLGVCALALAAGLAAARGDGLLVLGALAAVLALVAALRLVESPSAALTALTFVIVVFPVMRVVAGGAPLYAVDALALIGLVALARRPVPLTHYGWLVIVYVAAWVPAWTYQVVTLDLVQEPTYGFLRNALAVSTFFLAYACAAREGFWDRWTLTLALGASVTAVLALLQAARVDAASDLLRAAAPAFTSSAYRTYPDRAFALFAAPTILAGFFVLAILLLLPSLAGWRLRFRGLAWIALPLSFVGALATYSRQWVPALAVGLIVLSGVRLRSSGRLLAVTVLGVLLAWAFFAGGALDRSYLEGRFERLGTADVNVRTRIARQQEFVSLALERPSDFVLGKGFAGQDIVRRELVSTETAVELREGLSDNVFFLEVFNHGLVAGGLYLGLMVAALARILRAARRGGPHARKLAGIGAALAAGLTLHLLDNYFSEAVFMKMLLWITVGLGLRLAAEQRREVA